MPSGADFSQRFLERFSDEIDKFIRSPEHLYLFNPSATYDNREIWSEDDLERIKSLRIPALGAYASQPDMRLHKLGSLDDLDPLFADRLTSFLGIEEHCVVLNASGTGKTRLLFEALLKRWGFYFTCAHTIPARPYSCNDIWAALVELQINCNFTSNPFDDPSTAPIRTARNQQLAHNYFLRVLVARMTVFNRFLHLADAAGLRESPTLKLKWLVFQLRSRIFLGTDIFTRIAQALSLDHDDDMKLVTKLEELIRLCPIKLEIIALDDAHDTNPVFAQAFLRRSDNRPAPVLGELIWWIASSFPTSRLIVAGVDVNREVVQDALASSRNSMSRLTVWSSLGAFKTLTQMSTYLRYFLGELSDEECRGAFMYLRGRYNFTTIFVETVLQIGRKRMPHVVNTIFLRLSCFRLRNNMETCGDDCVRYAPIVPDKMLEDARVAGISRKALLAFVSELRPTTVSTYAHLIVKLSLGTFAEDEKEATIDEPVIFYRLAAWRSASKEYGLSALLQSRISSISAQDSGLAESLCRCVMSCFGGEGSALNKYLRFEGVSVPPWTQQVATLPRSVSSLRRPYRISRGEVHKWLYTQNRETFLIPDALHVLFFLDVQEVNSVLVCVDCFDHEPSGHTRIRNSLNELDEYSASPILHVRLWRGAFFNTVAAISPTAHPLSTEQGRYFARLDNYALLDTIDAYELEEAVQVLAAS